MRSAVDCLWPGDHCHRPSRLTAENRGIPSRCLFSREPQFPAKGCSAAGESSAAPIGAFHAIGQWKRAAAKALPAPTHSVSSGASGRRASPPESCVFWQPLTPSVAQAFCRSDPTAFPPASACSIDSNAGSDQSRGTYRPDLQDGVRQDDDGICSVLATARQ